MAASGRVGERMRAPGIRSRAGAVRAAATAFAVIFVAEWGDLTQILIANMAAHYHAVGILRVMPATVMHRISGALLALLAVLAATSALRG